MTIHGKISPQEMEQFYDKTKESGLVPGWLGRGEDEAQKTVPFLWRWADVEPLVHRSGEVVTPDRDVERRILRLANPGLRYGTTHTITAALQLLLPGECAPAHRHTPTAIRWVLEGEGVYTTVDGDKCYMERGDLILTPSWTWHDHNSEGVSPMVWLDGLDVPLVQNLDATFFEQYPEDQHPVIGTGDSLKRYGSGSLRPAWQSSSTPYSPLLLYKWDHTYQALYELSKVDSSPFDDVALEFSDPSTGGPVLRTLACWIQLVRPSVKGKAHRHTTSTVYQVFEGEGYSIIDGQRFDWKRGDLFAVPSWSWHEHGNESGQEAILFSIQDNPVMKSLSLFREEAYTENAGHQLVETHFN